MKVYLTYVGRRLLSAIPTLFIVLTIIFFMVRILPGDPAIAVLGSYASEAALENLRVNMGLNKPLGIQYMNFLKDILHGDLGKSMINQFPVSKRVAKALPYTLELTFSGIFLGFLFGVPTGILAALRRNRITDYFGRIFSLVGQSFPSFYIGIIFMFFLGLKCGVFPTMGGGNHNNPIDLLSHLFLPALTMGLIMAAYLTRLSRSSMLEVLDKDYVRTARAKGLRERFVILKHAFRNTLLPIISLTGTYIIILIGSSVMVEVVFSRPGLGSMMVGAALNRDYITLQSVMIVFSVIVVLTNLLTDLAYGFVDPRITYG